MLTLQDLLRTRTAQPQLNKAMYFNGVNAYIEIPHSPSYAKTRHTVMITFKPTSTQYLLISKGWWDYYRLLMFRIPYLDLRITRVDKTYFTFPSAMEPRVNVWTTIAYWLDERDANIKGAFKDGTFYTPNYIINPSYPLCFECPNPLRIMGEPGSAFYPGYIAQVLIYSRVLSNSEIIHNMLNPDNPIRDGLVLWLDARACYTSKNICYDLSGNGNHGTMYNVRIVSLPNQVVVGGSL
jgi:hypothetical protein